ncbi:unnamed protein product [Cylicostephanus goldi]|uniref:Uncharacterized protein n=1 Tax=Cylicostephanus goldi TaxID=71465 RepID=A0A3P6RD70_CYLGO|nr:unnamed protein product [Cylicostephanus goldi]
MLPDFRPKFDFNNVIESCQKSSNGDESRIDGGSDSPTPNDDEVHSNSDGAEMSTFPHIKQVGEVRGSIVASFLVPCNSTHLNWARATLQPNGLFDTPESCKYMRVQTARKCKLGTARSSHNAVRLAGANFRNSPPSQSLRPLHRLIRNG